MGIDTDLVVDKKLLDSQLKDLVCVYCEDLVDTIDALEAPCGHVFCSICILHGLLVTGPLCPHDKLPLQKEQLRPLKTANVLAYRMLGRTLVRCPNTGAGCSWEGELSELQAHAPHCNFKPSHCQCCAERGSELVRAKELIENYERLTEDLQRQLSAAQQRASQLQQMLSARAEGASYEQGPEPGGMLNSEAFILINGDGGLHPLPQGSSSAQSPTRTQGFKPEPTASRDPRGPEPWQGGIFFATLQGHYNGVNCLLLGPNATLYSASLDSSIKIWRAGICIATLMGHTGSVIQLALGEDGTLYSCSEDKSIRAWQQGKMVGFLEPPSLFGRIPVKLAARGDMLYAAYYGGGVTAFKDSKRIAILRKHGTGASYIALACGPDGTVYFSGSTDFKITCWKDGEVFASLVGHDDDVTSIVISADNILYSLQIGGAVRIWQHHSCILVLQHANALGDLLLGPDHTLYCGQRSSSEIRVWRGGSCVATLQGHSEAVVCLALGPGPDMKGSVLYSGDMRGNIKLWKGTTT